MANMNPDDTTEPIESVQSSEVPQGRTGRISKAAIGSKSKDSKSLTDVELFKAFSFAWDAGYKYGHLRGRLQRSNRGRKS